MAVEGLAPVNLGALTIREQAKLPVANGLVWETFPAARGIAGVLQGETTLREMDSAETASGEMGLRATITFPA